MAKRHDTSSYTANSANDNYNQARRNAIETEIRITNDQLSSYSAALSRATFAADKKQYAQEIANL